MNTKMTVDEKIDSVAASVEVVAASVAAVANSVDELAGMVARGFSEMQNDMLGMRDELRSEFKKEIGKVNKTLERHCKESEKLHKSFDKRVIVLERLQHI